MSEKEQLVEISGRPIGEEKEFNSSEWEFTTGKEKSHPKNRIILFGNLDRIGTPTFDFNSGGVDSNVADYFASRIKNISGINEVYYSQEGRDEHRLWIIIENEDFDTRVSIFEEKQDIENLFRAHSIYVHVITRDMDPDLSQVTDDAKLLYPSNNFGRWDEPVKAGT